MFLSLEPQDLMSVVIDNDSKTLLLRSIPRRVVYPQGEDADILAGFL